MFGTVNEEDELQEYQRPGALASNANRELAELPHMELIQRKVPTFETQDPLVEVKLGTELEPRMTKISWLECATKGSGG